MVNTDNEQAIAFYEGLGWKKHFMSGAWRGNMELWF
jgi:ribosomal protein S18 acetylase RimI-like enzyme